MFLERLISGTLPFAFLMICGIYLSFKTGFCQITRFGESFKLTARAFKNRTKTREITSYKAACTALSATVGTGNIAGVAGAISVGGAGAVFWMWVSAVLGMCIKFVEITLAVMYREKTENGFRGGPTFYIKNGLPKVFAPLGIIFCLFAIPATFCSGNITQINAAAISVSQSSGKRLILGVIFALACFISVTGGTDKIASITEKIVPLMSVIYIVVSLTVIIKNINSLPECFVMIFKGAFNPKAVTGGAVGSVFTSAFIGTSRGIFSNEAGLGTSAMAHSAAVDADPDTQGLFGVFEVFADTVLLSTLTALTILSSEVKINYGSIASTELVAESLEKELGAFGNISLGIMMCLFAFSSIVGWAVYGKLSANLVFGKTGNVMFNLLYPLFCILGATVNSDVSWRMAGICNGIMLCINLTAILLLSDKIAIKKGENNNGKNRKNKKDFTRRYRGINKQPN